MARRANPDNGRIPHPDYPYAYLKIRHDHYHTVVHDKPKSTGILAQTGNHKKNERALREAMLLLDTRVREYQLAKQHPELLTAKYEANNTNRQVIDLVKEYLKIRRNLKSVSDDTIRHHVSTYRTYLSVKLSITQTHELRQHIVERTASTNHKESTTKKNYQRLASFFDWCIKAGYCKDNPMDAIPKVYVPTPPEIVFPTFQELNQVIEHYRSGPNYIRYRNEREDNIRFWRFLAITGIRIGEAIKLRVEDFTVDGFRIDGKRKRHNEKKERWFLFDMIPGSRDLANECLQHALPNGNLWPWNNPQKPASNWRDCIRTLEMNEAYTPHSLRRLAKWWWEVELGIPPHLCNMLAGHSLAVRRSYHRTANLDDLKRYLRNDSNVRNTSGKAV